MKNGCSVAASGKNITVAIATVDGVMTEMAWDEEDSIALMGVMKKCEVKWGDRCEPCFTINPGKVYNVKWDTTVEYFPNAKQLKLLDKNTKRIERSDDAAGNYINQGNFEIEARHFIEKWGDKIRQINAGRF